MNKKRNLILVFALLFVTVLTGAIVANTYAKYTSTVDATSINGSVARWSFEFDNSNTILSFNLSQTYDTDTLVENKMAPGTSGHITMFLSNANTEVGTEYVVSILANNVPVNLKFYSDEAHTSELIDDQLSGTLKPGESTDVNIYWEWPYESGDDLSDTYDGISASDMTIMATITGTQVAPQ